MAKPLVKSEAPLAVVSCSSLSDWTRVAADDADFFSVATSSFNKVAAILDMRRVASCGSTTTVRVQDRTVDDDAPGPATKASVVWVATMTRATAPSNHVLREEIIVNGTKRLKHLAMTGKAGMKWNSRITKRNRSVGDFNCCCAAENRHKLWQCFSLVSPTKRFSSRSEGAVYEEWVFVGREQENWFQSAHTHTRTRQSQATSNGFGKK